MEKDRKKEIEKDIPPEFSFEEFGVAIKNFYLSKTRFAIYLTITIVLLIALVTLLIYMVNTPFPRNNYQYYMFGNYHVLDFNLLEFLGLGDNKVNMSGTCIPEYFGKGDDKHIINSEQLALCSSLSYWKVLNLKTILFQSSVMILSFSTIAMTLLSYKHWKLSYSKTYYTIKGFANAHHVKRKFIICFFVFATIATILGYVLNNH